MELLRVSTGRDMQDDADEVGQESVHPDTVATVVFNNGVDGPTLIELTRPEMEWLRDFLNVEFPE